jgi:hypothetical protein
LVKLTAPPPNAPLNNTLLAAVTVVFAESVPASVNVNAPVFDASPNDTAPPMFNTFASVLPATESLDTVAPANVSTPVPNAALSPTRTMPALNTAPPSNVFAPPKVNVPPPAFVNANDPPKTPPKITSLDTVSAVSASNVPEPLNVSTPVFVASPIPTAPLNSYAFANVRSPAPALVVLETVAPAIFKTPVPNAASFPAKTLPANTSAPPAKVFAPLNVNSPAPVFRNDPTPLITPE